MSVTEDARYALLYISERGKGKNCNALSFRDLSKPGKEFTPIVRDDYVFFTAGYNRGGALLKQVPGEGGEIKIEEVYPLNVKLASKHGGVCRVAALRPDVCRQLTHRLDELLLIARPVRAVPR